MEYGKVKLYECTGKYDKDEAVIFVPVVEIALPWMKEESFAGTFHTGSVDFVRIVVVW